MKRIVGIIKTTAFGGIVFLLPFVAMIVIVLKGFELLEKFIEPVAVKLGIEGFAGKASISILGIIVLIVICFVAGMIVQSGKLKFNFPIMDSIAGKIIPGYQILKAESGEKEGKTSGVWKAVLLKTEEGWKIVFIIDQNQKITTLFVPHAPHMESGEVLMVSTSDMETKTISVKDARHYISKYGAGAAELFS